jgi:hypothetical protein
VECGQTSTSNHCETFQQPGGALARISKYIIQQIVKKLKQKLNSIYEVKAPAFKRQIDLTIQEA